VQSFIADGGSDAALKTLSAPTDKTSAFSLPDRRFLRAQPAMLAPDASPDAFHAAYPPSTKARTVTPEGKRPLSLALYIPEGFERGEPIRAWTNGRTNPYLLNIVQAELSRALKAKAVAQAGLDPAAIARLDAVSAPMVIIAPPQAQTAATALKSALPSLLAYVLMITVSITGSMLLQSVMEERGNKLLESVLACVTPHELMYGKLFGICGVGLTVIGTWGAFGLIAFRLAPPEFQSAVHGILASMNSPMLLAAILFYYFAGYFMISLLFLAIGAIADSMQDAQGYLTPLMLLLILPFALVLPRAMQDSSSLGPVIMSWIPLYTPFAMLSRLGNGVSTTEVLGTSALLLSFLALEFWLIGRLFKANLLRTGQRKPFRLFRKAAA
jgi:ABC-2 type transport system permease protein